MIVTDAAALILIYVDPVNICFVVGSHCAAFSEGIQVLARIEAETSDVSKTSDTLSFIFRAMCLRTVFSHKESVPVRNLLYPVKRKRLSIQMNADDAFGMLRNLLFDPVRIISQVSAVQSTNTGVAPV